MPKTNPGTARHSYPGELQVPIFSIPAKTLWLLLFAATIFSELMPVPLMPRRPFYLYCLLKSLCFIAVGCVAPLAFRRFTALNWGILLATMSATGVESLQGLIHHGHSFHWYELVVKLVLILTGFALGLDVCYDRKIAVGPMVIILTDE